MLTKDDLQAIGTVIDNRLDKRLKPIEKDIKVIQKDMGSVKSDIATLKSDTSETRKDVKVIISYFDREYVNLRRRIEKIEQHLGLTT